MLRITSNALGHDTCRKVGVRLGSVFLALLTLFSLLFPASIAQAQAPSVLWSSAAYGADDVYAVPGEGKKPIGVDANGNVYVAGTTTDGKREQFLTVKYDPNGTRLWRTILAGDDTARGAAIAVDAAGSSYVTGVIVPDTGQINNLASYAVTVKYNTDGVEQWRTVHGAPSTSSSISLAADGSVYVIGVESGALIIKYNANGTEAWHRNVQSPGYYPARFSDMTFDSAGNIVVTAFVQDAAAIEIATIKFSPDGTELQRQKYADPFTTNARTLALDPNGDVFVAGCAIDSNNYTFINKHTASGAKLWERHTVDANPAAGRQVCDTAALAVDGMGNAYLVAHAVDATGAPDYLTIKYAPDGTVLWSAVLNSAGNGIDVAGSVMLDSAANVYVGGRSTSTDFATHEFLVVKYSSSGTEQWRVAKSDVNGPLNITAMVVDADNNFLMTTGSMGAQSTDLQTVKISPSGVQLWLGSEGVATGLATRFYDKRRMAVDAVGNTYINGAVAAGTTSAFLGPLPLRTMTIKYGADGTEQWRTRTDANLYPFVLETAPNGELVMAAGVDSLYPANIAIIRIDASTGAEISRVVTNGSTNDTFSLYQLKFDAARNMYVMGGSPRSDGGFDGLLFKINAAGVVQWRRVIASRTANVGTYFADMALDAACNVFLTGNYDGSQFGVLVTAKYDTDGNELWRSQLAFSPPAYGLANALSVVVDDGGNAIVAASNSRQTGGGQTEYVIVKYGPSGSESWRRTSLPTNAGNEIHSIKNVALDSAGNILVSGSYNRPATSGRDFGYLTIKYNSLGDELWRAHSSTPTDVFVESGTMTIDAQDNIYVLRFNAGLFIVKYTPDGIERFRLTPANTPPSAGAEVLAVIADGSLITGGEQVDVHGIRTLSVRKYSQLAEAPTITSAMPGNGLATIAFSPPASDGGSPIIGYTVNCDPGAISVAGSSSPIILTGLANGALASCSVRARNVFGLGPASSIVSVTPSSTAEFALVSVESHKTHGAAGLFKLSIKSAVDISDAVTIEPRATGMGHRVVFRFNGPVSVVGAVNAVDAVSVPVGTVSTIQMGNDVTVTLRDIQDNQRVRISLAGINDLLDVSVSVGFFIGDINGSRAVNAGDISGIKRRLGLATDVSNFLFDLDTSGSIDAHDVTMVKARAGHVLH